MKITKEGNTLNFEFKNGSMIALWENISQFWGKKECNWYTWNLINIEIENDVQCGHYEIQFVLLGLGLRILIPNETKKSAEFMGTLDKSLKDIKSWKTVWLNADTIKRLNHNWIIGIETKRPKKYKGYKKSYLQIN